MDLLLYNQIRKVSVPRNVLFEIRDRYQNVIRSERRMARILSMADLLDILRKRDELKTSDLKNIAHFLNLHDEIQVTIIPNHAHAHPVETQSHTKIENFPAGLQDVYKKISQEMGPSKWREFARKLDMEESKIDRLSTHKDCTKRCLEVLYYHHNQALPCEWRQNLLSALDAVRRNDLRQYVESRLNHHNIIRPHDKA